MLNGTCSNIDDDVSMSDWRRQAASAFGQDAIIPMTKQFLSLLQSIYASSCRDHEQRSMSVQFLSLEDDPFTNQLSELFAAFAAEQLGAPVCLMSFDTANRIKVANYGMFNDRHPLRGAPAATISHKQDVDLGGASEPSLEMDAPALPRSDRQRAELATIDHDPASRLGTYIERERSRAALLVVNARPIGRSFESLMISRKVDGVIMVIDAGDTEAEAALAAREKVLAVDGHLLGVVLKQTQRSRPATSTGIPSMMQYLKLDDIWPSLSRKEWVHAGVFALSLGLIIGCIATVAHMAAAPMTTSFQPFSTEASVLSAEMPERHDVFSPSENDVEGTR